MLEASKPKLTSLVIRVAREAHNVFKYNSETCLKNVAPRTKIELSGKICFSPNAHSLISQMAHPMTYSLRDHRFFRSRDLNNFQQHFNGVRYRKWSRQEGNSCKYDS